MLHTEITILTNKITKEKTTIETNNNFEIICKIIHRIKVNKIKIIGKVKNKLKSKFYLQIIKI